MAEKLVKTSVSSNSEAKRASVDELIEKKRALDNAQTKRSADYNESRNNVICGVFLGSATAMGLVLAGPVLVPVLAVGAGAVGLGAVVSGASIGGVGLVVGGAVGYTFGDASIKAIDGKDSTPNVNPKKQKIRSDFEGLTEVQQDNLIARYKSASAQNILESKDNDKDKVKKLLDLFSIPNELDEFCREFAKKSLPRPDIKNDDKLSKIESYKILHESGKKVETKNIKILFFNNICNNILKTTYNPEIKIKTLDLFIKKLENKKYTSETINNNSAISEIAKNLCKEVQKIELEKNKAQEQTQEQTQNKGGLPSDEGGLKQQSLQLVIHQNLRIASGGVGLRVFFSKKNLDLKMKFPIPILSPNCFQYLTVPLKNLKKNL